MERGCGKMKADMYPDWMKENMERDKVKAVPYQNPTQLPLPSWFNEDKWPHFSAPEVINGIYRCQRCGICLTTKGCAVMTKDPNKETSTPRARIALARAILEERISIAEIPLSMREMVDRCNYCGKCSTSCIVNVSYREKVSAEKNIDHNKIFLALQKTLAGRSGI